MSNYIHLSNGILSAKINPKNGQLVELKRNNIHFFHDGGSDTWQGHGWNSSEIVPFPIFGSVKEYQVKIKDHQGKDQKFPLDQHGISRHLQFIVKTIDQTTINLLQQYKGTALPNSKFKPGSERPQYVKWLPYDLNKTFRLVEDSLVCQITITNQSEIEIPYMLGWHPAFRILGPKEQGIIYDTTGKQLATLDQIIESSVNSKGAILLEGINSVQYLNKETNRGINISSQDYPHMILWSPSKDAEMVCIEHTTQLPNPKREYFSNNDQFERLSPGNKKTYTINVNPFQ